MAIVSIREGYTGHQAGGESGNKTAIRRFSMTTDDPTDDARFTWPQNDPVDNTIIIPAPGTYYPGHEDIRSREPQVKKISPCFFNIEVSYGANISSKGEEEEDEFAANPLSKPAEEIWDSSSTIAPIYQDINGVPYVDTFNKPVIGMEREFLDEVLYLTRNEAAFNELAAFHWKNKVYDGVFRNAARGRVLMKRIRIEHIKDEVIDSATFGEILYSRVAYEIHFRHLDIPLINAWELKKSGGNVVFERISDNETNQAYYAWFRRRLHTSRFFVDGNGKFVGPKDQDEQVRIAAGIVVPENEIGDFVLQQEYPFAVWPGVA